MTLDLPGRPDYINICSCRLCRTSGAAWGYYRPQDVSIAGTTAPFERSDIDDVWLTLHFCPRCGATTHYSPTGRAPLDQMGVNLRLVAQDELEGVPVKWQDGRSVETEGDDFIVTGTGHIGDGKAF